MVDLMDLVRRLRGEYRIPITDGLGPAGGEEPDNPTEFVLTFQTPPIQKEAAGIIEALNIWKPMDSAPKDRKILLRRTLVSLRNQVAEKARDLGVSLEEAAKPVVVLAIVYYQDPFWYDHTHGGVFELPMQQTHQWYDEWIELPPDTFMPDLENKVWESWPLQEDA